MSVAALFDWEGATIGPPGIDLGWWLMFERYLCEAQGLRRLDGVPGRAETIARYAELGGAPVPDIDYYELLAAVVMTLITSRLADVLVETGRVTPDIAAIYPTRAVALVADSLARVARPANPPAPTVPPAPAPGFRRPHSSRSTRPPPALPAARRPLPRSPRCPCGPAPRSPRPPPPALPVRPRARRHPAGR